ncbi:MAG: ABC transporter permease [Alicyclobacillus sp.]|nr:ABC transporter permease [Alicyclobacillus sp.]
MTSHPTGPRPSPFWNRHRDAVLAYVILFVVLVLFAVNQSDFFTPYGPQSIFNQVITLSVAALAQTIVVLTAGIDLSVGAVVGLTNCIAATVFDPVARAVGGNGPGIAAVSVLVLAVGALAGLANGVIIVYGRLQPIIVTLATASVYSGLALYIRPTPGGSVPVGFCTFLTGNVLRYIPVSAIALFVFIGLVWFPVRRSRFGQALYAIGGNESSAFVSGIAIRRTKVLAYTLSGLFCACAGLLLTAQTASGDALGSSMYTLNTIAAVVLGGTSLAGGKGGYVGSVAGAAVLSLILGLLIFWGVSSFYQDAVQGIILILALAAGLLNRPGRKIRIKHAG